MPEHPDAGTRRTVARQRQDLIAYLTRVQNLPLPTRDLIFLHSEAGAGAEIEATTVDRLALMARNGQTDELDETFSDLPERTQEAAIVTLAMWVDSFPLALERANAVKVLLAAVRVVTSLSPETTARAAGAVLAAPGDLPTAVLADIVALARRSEAPQRQQLVDKLATRTDLTDSPGVRQALISAAGELPTHDRLSGKALVRSIREQDESAMQTVLLLEQDLQSSVLEQGDTDVDRWIAESVVDEGGDAEGTEAEHPDSSDVRQKLAWAMDQVEASPAACSRIASWLLGLENPDADDAVNRHLDSIRPVEDEELATRMLARAPSRPRDEREIWLAAMSPNSLGDDGASGLDGVAQVVWTEMAAEDAESERYTATLDQLARLRDRATGSDTRRTQAAIAETLSQPMADDAQAWLLLRASKLATEFVMKGLADSASCANALVRSCTSVIQGLPIGAPAEHPELRQAVSATLDEWVASTSVDGLAALRDAASQAPDEALDPTRAEALLVAAGKLKEDGGEQVSPVSPGALGNLANALGEGAAPAIVAWTRYFAADAQLWSVVAPMWADTIPPSIRRPLGEAAKRLSEAERQAVAESAVDQTLTTELPPPDNWEAIGFRDVKARWVVEALAKRIPEDSDDLDRWRRLLEICRQRAPGDRAKEAIARELLQPLAQHGSDDAVDLVLDHLELVGRKHSEILLNGLSLTTEQTRRLDAKLTELGWKKGALARLLGGFLDRSETQ